MVVAVVMPAVNGNLESTQRSMALVLAATSVMAFWIRVCWPLEAGDFGMHVVVGLVSVSGLAAILSGEAEKSVEALSFCGLLILRNYVCFNVLPRSVLARRTILEHTVIRWMALSALIVAVGGLAVAARMGVNLWSGIRLTGEGNNWLNANTTGLYCGVGLVACVFGGNMRLPFRIACGLLCGYVLLLTQSRTAMAAVAATICAYYLVVGAKRIAIGLAVGAFLYFGAVSVQDTALSWTDALLELGQFRTMLERSTGISPTAHRLEIIGDALDDLERAPVFGHGYLSAYSRIENGYVSMACESGLVGLGVYLVFVGLVVSRFVRLRRWQAVRERRLAAYGLALTVFVLVHALGERSHGFQIGSVVSHAWLLLGGIACGCSRGPGYLVSKGPENRCTPSFAAYWRTSGVEPWRTAD
jgi:O-antigen ligase